MLHHEVYSRLRWKIRAKVRSRVKLVPYQERWSVSLDGSVLFPGMPKKEAHTRWRCIVTSRQDAAFEAMWELMKGGIKGTDLTEWGF